MSGWSSKISSWWKAEERKLQGERFGLGLASALALMAGLSMFRGLMERMETLALVSAALLAAALIYPQLLAAPAWLLEEGFKTLTRGLLYLLLVLVFFLVFAPVGLALRLLGKDPLQRRLQPEAETYWIPRRPKDPKHIERQF